MTYKSAFISWFLISLILFACCCVIFAQELNSGLEFQNNHYTEVAENVGHSTSEEPSATSENETETLTYKIARLAWKEVNTPYAICLWILLACVAKINSSLLIILGLCVGFVLYFIMEREDVYHLPSAVFFLYLLPPIVFDAGYFMPNRAFFDNLGTILVYAVLGTLWNTFSIGLSLWAIGLTGIFSVQIGILEMLTFTSLISAVDPVAVLVVFEEIHINALLYIVVFGESLLNDAVTVVLYEMFETFTEIGYLEYFDYVKAVIAFFVVSLGGVLIGVTFAGLCSFITKFTKKVRVIEPLLIFLWAYLAYLTAQMFHLSAILAVVFCGICMKQFVEANISQKSKTTLQYLIKMLCTCCETIIFMFLGLSTVQKHHVWDAAFISLTLFFCLVYRAFGVLFLTFFVNKGRLTKLTKVAQFIMAYGGLRGAIAYGLVSALHKRDFPGKELFVTTTIVVIYFTVFLQNIDHLVAGIEAMTGMHGHHWRRSKFERFNERYVKPLLITERTDIKDTSIVRAFTQINLAAARDHMEKFGTFHNFSNPSHIDRTTSSGALQGVGSKATLTIPRVMNGEAQYSNPAFVPDDEKDIHTMAPSASEIRRRSIMDAESEAIAKRLLMPGIRRYSRDIQDSPVLSKSNSLEDLSEQAKGAFKHLHLFHNPTEDLLHGDFRKRSRKHTVCGTGMESGQAMQVHFPGKRRFSEIPASSRPNSFSPIRSPKPLATSAIRSPRPLATSARSNVFDTLEESAESDKNSKDEHENEFYYTTIEIGKRGSTS